jgi:hypothetical protein
MKVSEMRRIVMLAVVISVLIASLPSAHALSGTHPSGPQEIHIVAMSGGLSVKYEIVTVTVKIHGPMGNSVPVTISLYFGGNNPTNADPNQYRGALVYQATATLTLTVNPQNPNERSGTVTFSVPLTSGAGYYLYLTQLYNPQNQWIGQDWIDPRQGTGG